MQLSKLLTLTHIMEWYGMLNFDTYIWLKQEDNSIESKTKGQAMVLRIDFLQYNRFVKRLNLYT